MRRIPAPSLAVALLAWPCRALADGGASAVPFREVAFRAGLSLVAVLGVIAALAFLLRRLQNHSFRSGGSRVASVARLELGARREIRIVRVDDRELLVGVTANRVDLLTELAGEPAPEPRRAMPGLQVLRKLTTSS